MADSQQLGILSKLVIALAVLVVLAGTIWHGVALATIERLWPNLVQRPDKPMGFRFILQPGVATIVAIRDGLRDTRAHRMPFFGRSYRVRESADRLREGLNATARIFLLGLLVDLICQLLRRKTFYPIEAVIVAFVGFVPYALVRGPASPTDGLAALFFANSPTGNEALKSHLHD